MTYNRDMQEDKEPLFEAADQVSGSLEMARVVIGFGEAEPCRARQPRPKRAGWWPPIWPKRWRAPARRSTRRIRWWAGWCLKACGKARSRPIGPPRSWRRSRRSSDRRWCALLDPAEGMKSREIPGGTGPAAVAKALAEARAAPGTDARMSKSYRQGQILKLIRAKSHRHAGRAGAGTARSWASPPRR